MTLDAQELNQLVEYWQLQSGRAPTSAELKAIIHERMDEELLARDKVSLDLTWLRDESLEDSASLPDPDVLAQEIADDLRSALGQIEDILGDLQQRRA